MFVAVFVNHTFQHVRQYERHGKQSEYLMKYGSVLLGPSYVNINTVLPGNTGIDSRFMLAEFSYQRHMKLASIQVQKLPSSAMYSTSKFVIGLCPEKWVNNKPQVDSCYKDKTIIRLSSFHNAKCWRDQCRIDCRFAPSQLETSLLCKDVSHLQCAYGCPKLELRASQHGGGLARQELSQDDFVLVMRLERVVLAGFSYLMRIFVQAADFLVKTTAHRQTRR